MADVKEGVTDIPELKVRSSIFNGVAMSACAMDEVEKLEIKEDDIWICSFPRSGTTLIQELTYLVQTLDFETARTVQLDDRFPILEVSDDRFPYYRGVKFVEQMKSPRMIKSHLHHYRLPVQLQEGKGRIIYIARNPKDVAASFIKFLKWTANLEESHNAYFIDAFVNGTGLYCPWPRHVLEFWDRRNDENVLFLKYEEVVEDKPTVVRQIANFLDRTLTDADVAKICDYTTVENMKNNPMCNMSYWKNVKKVFDCNDGGFINQGKVGTWKTFLTPETGKKIESLLDEIKGSGLTLKDE